MFQSLGSLCGRALPALLQLKGGAGPGPVLGSSGPSAQAGGHPLCLSFYFPGGDSGLMGTSGREAKSLVGLLLSCLCSSPLLIIQACPLEEV